MIKEKEIVLIVDDDEDVLNTICKIVETSNFACDRAINGIEAVNKLRANKYSLIIMDVNMPDMNGFEAIQAIRESDIDIPIIIVSGRKEDVDTLYGLDIGADDYITKPFNPVILGAKIKALIRRSKQIITDGVIVKGPFSYDVSTLRFYKNGEEIFLSGKENALMKLFFDNESRILTKDVIFEMIWNSELIDEQSIAVYVNRIRSKIEDDPFRPKYLRTVRGLGYRFEV